MPFRLGQPGEPGPATGETVKSGIASADQVIMPVPVLALRGALVLQALVMAVVALLGSGTVGWTLMTVVLASTAVFLAAAVQAGQPLRAAVIGFEVVCLGFGVLALTGGYVAPGTLLGVLVLLVAQGRTPSVFAPAPVPVLEVFGAPRAPVPVQSRRRVRPVAPAARQPGEPQVRAASRTVLPR